MRTLLKINKKKELEFFIDFEQLYHKLLDDMHRYK